MEVSEVKLAIVAITFLEIAFEALSVISGKGIDPSTLATGIAAIAGLAGVELKKTEHNGLTGTETNKHKLDIIEKE